MLVRVSAAGVGPMPVPGFSAVNSMRILSPVAGGTGGYRCHDSDNRQCAEDVFHGSSALVVVVGIVVGRKLGHASAAVFGIVACGESLLYMYVDSFNQGYDVANPPPSL